MQTKPLLAAMYAKANFELVEESSAPSQLRLLGRIPLDKAGVNMNNWLIVIRQLLVASQKAPWKVDVSKDYFLRAGKVVYAWRIILQAPNLEAHLGDVAGVIGGAPPTSRTEVTEIALPGVTGDRNAPIRGKGAGAIGSMPVGPMAVYAKQMGNG